MKIIIVGAGPAGLTLGAALARRHHRVTVVDRDPGPAPDGSWRRRGVMQFEQAHGFRPQVGDLLRSEWPDAWRTWLALGADPFPMASSLDPTPELGVRSRRVTYERALRHAAARLPGLCVVVGNVSGLAERHGRVSGVVVDGATHAADLVVDASGRLTRLSAPPVLAGDAGMSYVSRTYWRPPGVEPGPVTSPVAWSGMFTGYDAYVFPHEGGHLSVVLIRPSADADLRVLRHLDAFEAASRAIPAVAAWTDRAVPTSGVLVGGSLLNAYRPQAGRPGLVAVGDAVATTAPTAGRGIAMASMQIRALLDVLDAGVTAEQVAQSFGAWTDTWIRPWVEDHLDFDAETVRRWQGEDIDLDRPLTSMAIVNASQHDPRIGPLVAPFLAMSDLPRTLSAAEPLARGVYEKGWRPPLTDGPTRDELLAIAHAGVRGQGTSRRVATTRPDPHPRRGTQPRPGPRAADGTGRISGLAAHPSGARP